ncbi:MAG: ABC transporter permease [Cytophagia bacterium]|nr:ABC transporter permease [Cytophagia bacterium]
MFKNYLKIGLRNLVKHKAHSVINVLGLAIGMCCFLLIGLFVLDESSFDRFHEGYENIYRITEVNYSEGGETKLANAFSAIGPALKNDFPELSSFVRIHVDEFTVGVDIQNEFKEANFAFADSSFWQVFDFQLIEGDPKEALANPFSLVLSQSAAQRHFGNESPLGKTLRVNGQYDFQVVGLMEDMPHNSHLQLDMIASFVSLRQLEGGWMFNSWYWPPMYTYARIPESVNKEQVEAKFPGMIEKYLGELVVQQRGYELQPIEEIHTSTEYSNEIGQPINKAYLRVLGITAFLVLIIACINFMNLSLAKSIGRSSEVGIRKVFGAIRPQIMRQYLIESLILSLLAAILSIAIFYLVIPAFNSLAQKQLNIGISKLPMILAGFLGIALVVGLLSGVYPALFLSRLSPNVILRGKVSKQGTAASIFRKGLIVFQFLVSSVLIISTVIIYYQVNYLQNKSMGFDKEQMVVLKVDSDIQQNNIKLFKDRLEQLPQVKGASVSARIPGYNDFYDYNVLPQGESVENNLVFMRLETDLDFAALYDLEILSGRGFDNQLGTDSTTYLLNETAIEKLGWSAEEALNKKLYLGSLNSNGSFRAAHQGNVIGVVKDFNFKSLHSKVDPLVISIIPKSEPYMQQNISIKLAGEPLSESVGVIEEAWSQFAPNQPMEYFFLDDAVQRFYSSEKRMMKVFLTFSSISIILACMGLFAMTTLMAARLKKEVGIRKVLGARVLHIVWRISSGFLLLISVSFAMACFISYIVMTDWLRRFAYQINLTPQHFLVAGLLLGLIVLGTISIKSIKAAYANPVDSLRQE